MHHLPANLIAYCKESFSLQEYSDGSSASAQDKHHVPAFRQLLAGGYRRITISKKDGKDQESIQLSTKPDQGYYNGK